MTPRQIGHLWVLGHDDPMRQAHENSVTLFEAALKKAEHRYLSRISGVGAFSTITLPLELLETMMGGDDYIKREIARRLETQQIELDDNTLGLVFSINSDSPITEK